MDYSARFPEVMARPATFDDDGDKFMVLFRDSLPVEILAKGVFDLVYIPAGNDDPPPFAASAPATRRPDFGKRRHARAQTAKAVKPSREAAPVATPGARTAEILTLLRKKPMSSGELVEVMKVNSSIVYSTLHVMKEKGMVEGRLSDIDGTRRWFVL